MPKMKQLSFADTYEKCAGLFEDHRPEYIKLLEENLDISQYIPVSFYNAFYQHYGRKRLYSLDAFISALLLQKIIGIPTDKLLIFILKSSRELRDYCGFEKVPDSSKLTRFKQDFMPWIEQLFTSLVDITEPLCRKINKELAVEKKSDSPDEDKSIGDSKLLKPVLSDYLKAHPGFSYDTFMGDSAFDSYDTYPFLLDDCNFKKALIPLNKRNSSSLPEPCFDENGRPLCPFDNSLPMKYAGITRGKNRSVRYKWTCPKTKFVHGKIVCSCENPCSPSKSGRAFYTHSGRRLRLYPEITNTMLTNTLRQLESDGIINRTQFNEIPPHVEYSLTERGQALRPILIDIVEWSQEYLH